MEHWELALEDREAVIAALARGECDGIPPAASGGDGFGCCYVENPVPALLDLLPATKWRRVKPPQYHEGGDALLRRPPPAVVAHPAHPPNTNRRQLSRSLPPKTMLLVTPLARLTRF